jgi:sporulation protein YlmC with PRC-barrel domain
MKELIMSKQAHTSTTALEKLKDTDLTFAEESLDIRGRKVVDRSGAQIGHVSALFIDETERKIRMLEIRAGGFLELGSRHFLLPVDAVTHVSQDEVRIGETQERLEHSPVYNPALIEEPTQEHWEPFYGYYGLSPYWSSGYMYPNFPMSPEEIASRGHTVQEKGG